MQGDQDLIRQDIITAWDR